MQVSRSNKNINRVLTIVTKAAERCLDDPVVNKAISGYELDDYTIKLSMVIFQRETIEIDISDRDPTSLILIFLKSLSNEVKEILSAVKIAEKQFLKDHRSYGEGFGDSPAIALTGLLMFKSVLDSIAENTTKK